MIRIPLHGCRSPQNAELILPCPHQLHPNRCDGRSWLNRTNTNRNAHCRQVGKVGRHGHHVCQIKLHRINAASRRTTIITSSRQLPRKGGGGGREQEINPLRKTRATDRNSTAPCRARTDASRYPAPDFTLPGARQYAHLVAIGCVKQSIHGVPKLNAQARRGVIELCSPA